MSDMLHTFLQINVDDSIFKIVSSKTTPETAGSFLRQAQLILDTSFLL
jgi:hypothetical protein